MNVRPTGDRVVLEELHATQKEQQTASGIILPDSGDKDTPKQGRVVALGEGRRQKDGSFLAFPYAEGATVLYTSGFGTQKLLVENKEYVIVRDEDILGIVEG